MRVFPAYVPLRNEWVRLEPLVEGHRAGLAQAAADPAIWRLQTFDIEQGFDPYFDWLRTGQCSGRLMPYAVVDPDGRVVGATSFLDWRPRDSGIEIGATWYAPCAQGTTINPGAKLLLLDAVFEAGIRRVQLKTDVLNVRSQAAIKRLGAKFEGILRSDRRRPDGTWRDTVYFSILSDEWPKARRRLLRRLRECSPR